MKAPRIMLAAGRSGSGKTMITCGLLRALQQMGKQPAAFKCGPDYIDPMFHEQVIGAPSCNLDPFFTEEETTQYLFCKHAAGHDISVLEGVMGYYDGLGGISTKGSAYDLAGMTKTPVLLVVDAKGMSVSALAFIKGYLQYKEDSRIAGVIFNRMSEMLHREIAPMAEKELGISCVGFVPELKECHLESRHLGLVMPDEVENLQEQVNLLAETLQKTLDFEKILAIAEGAEELSGKMPESLRKVTESEAAAKVRAAKPILAVAKDEAFCFFYRDNLELLASLGAKIEYFSPLSDAEPPKNTDGFLFCGGYPELHAEELSETDALRKELEDTGYIRRRKVPGGFKEKKFKAEPHKYTLKDGSTVLVGRNNKENDFLTFKTASSKDIWLHTKNIPGSHVILQSASADPAEESIYAAASIAAYYSKAKTSENVPVDYVPVKYVKKPAGAKPGMVIFTNNRTVWVNPKLPE